MHSMSENMMQIEQQDYTHFCRVISWKNDSCGKCAFIWTKEAANECAFSEKDFWFWICQACSETDQKNNISLLIWHLHKRQQGCLEDNSNAFCLQTSMIENEARMNSMYGHLCRTDGWVQLFLIVRYVWFPALPPRMCVILGTLLIPIR